VYLEAARIAAAGGDCAALERFTQQVIAEGTVAAELSALVARCRPR
jgi:hypothetical protein